MQVVKVGRSSDPKRRMDSLQTAHPTPLRLLATIDGDHEKLIHQRIAPHRKQGEWFTWNEQTRATLREFAAKELPAIRTLTCNRKVSEGDWILAAERASGGRVEIPSSKKWDDTYDLIHDAACALECRVIDHFKQQLIDCELESLSEFDSGGFENSEDWASNMMEEETDCCPLTECDERLLEKYLIGVFIAENLPERVEVFWHDPVTAGGRTELRNYLMNVRDWVFEYDFLEFKGWIWSKKRKQFDLFASSEWRSSPFHSQIKDEQ